MVWVIIWGANVLQSQRGSGHVAVESQWRFCVNYCVSKIRIAASLILTLASLLFVASPGGAQAYLGIYGGGPFYSGGNSTIQSTINDLKSSGFTNVICWSIHVSAAGDLIYNGPTIVSNGVYVGDSAWPAYLAELKQPPTSVTHLTFSFGSADVQDFANIGSLIAAQGTGPSSILYKNVLALKQAIPSIDTIDFDDEDSYNQTAVTQFALMLGGLGYKVTFAPYTFQSFWINCLSSINSQSPGLVTAFNLQCYSGGTGNDPGQWESAVQQAGYAIPVYPGLLIQGSTPASIESQFAAWETEGVNGGFYFIYDSIPSTGYTSVDFTNALLAGLGDTTLPIGSTSPVVSALSPTSVTAGPSSIPVTIFGKQFVSGCTVNVGSTMLTPTFISSSELLVRIPSTAIAGSGSSVSVSVNNGAGSGGVSNALTLLVTQAPSPAVTGITPSSVYAASPAFTLQVNGSGFNSYSDVEIDGTGYTPSSESSNSISVTVPASVVAVVGTHTVKVNNFAVGGLSASSATLTATATPTPTLSSISPTQVLAGTTSLVITLTGTNFYTQSGVSFNGNLLPASAVTYNSSNPNQLLAAIPDAYITTASTGSGYPVEVVNPGQAGIDGGTTLPQYLQVFANGVPVILSFTPSSVLMGSGDTVITINGTNFNPFSAVTFNGSVAVIIPPTTPSSTVLQATLPAADAVNSGFVAVQVINQAPNGGTASANLPIAQPLPQITAPLVPSPYLLGTSGPLVINGSGFTTSSTVTLTGLPASSSITIVPTLNSPTQLQIAIPGNLPANNGTIGVTVTNPTPLGGTSNSVPLTLDYPAPVLTSIDPTTIPLGTPSQLLTLSGSGFEPGDSVLYTFGTTTISEVGSYDSSSTMTSQVPASATATLGTVTVQVSAPGQSGTPAQISAPQALTISPITIVSFGVSPTSVAGGDSVSGTISLDSAAPAGGIPVTLSLSSGPVPALQFPSTVTVPAGLSTLTFNGIQTNVVATNVTVQLTATVGLTSQSATLIITGTGGSTYNSGLQFFSVPNAYKDTLQDIFVSPLAAPDEIASYNPSSFGYTYQGPAGTVSMTPGIGYWTLFPSGGDNLLSLGTPASTKVATTISLVPGWNGIGDPYTIPVNISDLVFTKNSYTFAQAISPTLSLISPTLYFFLQDSSGESGIYGPTGAGGTLVTGEGYWIYSYSASTLTFPLPSVAGGAPSTTVTKMKRIPLAAKKGTHE